jgi:hypothetical protein
VVCKFPLNAMEDDKYSLLFLIAAPHIIPNFRTMLPAVTTVVFMARK